MNLIFIYLYFYLPGALANIGANIGRFIPGFRDWNHPVDFHLSLRGQRLVGNHKKIGSFVFGVLFGSLIGVIKTLYLDKYFSSYLLIHQSALANIIMYTLISFGALFGDLVKSFAKRQLGRAEHTPWIPFDEIDHSTISLLLAKLFFPLAWIDMLGIIVLAFFAHLLSNVIGYFLKIKDVPY